MKNSFLLMLLVFLNLQACKEKQTPTTAIKNMASTNSETFENAIIYEANIRQYSPEGSFNAFTACRQMNLSFSGQKILEMLFS